MFNRHLLSQLKTQPALFVATVGAQFTNGLFIIVQAWLLSRVINRVFLQQALLTQVSSELVLLATLIVLRSVLIFLGEASASALAIKIKTELRQLLVAHILKLGATYTQDERTGELTTTAVEGIESLDAYFSQYVPQLVVAAIVPLSVLLVVTPLDLLSGIVLFLTAPLIPIFMILIGQATAALTRRQYDLLSRLSAHFLDVLQGLTTLKQLGASGRQANVIAAYSDRYRQATLEVLRVAFLSALVLELVATISTALVAVEIGLRLLYAQLDFQAALFILILAPEFYLPLRMLGLRFHAAASGASAAQRIFQILQMPVPLNAPQALTTAPATFKRLVFKRVRVTYDDQVHALDGITCEIAAGKKIALVGASGAGKSTLLKLLLRFIAPHEGEIHIDDRALETWTPDAWRTQVAWVPQQPHLFYDTVANNIRVAKPSATFAEVQAAATRAHAHDFISALPDAYDSLIGEQGVRLSGGQAQRLALARAFLKDAPLLLLDEPTAHLDAELEAQWQHTTRALWQGRTVISIAHRLTTVQHADRILVLERGRMVEQGTHDLLLAQAGVYAQLWRKGFA